MLTLSGIDQRASREWSRRPADERFKTLTELRDAVHSRRTRSRSTNIETDKLRATNVDGELRLNGAIAMPSRPTHWAFGQLTNQIKAPADYIRTLPTDLAVDCVNHGIANHKRDRVKVLSIETADGDDSMMAALTSTKYGRVWDADVVEAAMKIQSRTDGKFFNPKDWSGTPSGLYASDRDVFVFMIDGGSWVDGGGRDSEMHRGFFMWNSEVGSRSFGICAFLFRAVCGNHLIWGAQNVQQVRIRHTTRAPERFADEATPMLLDMAQESTKPLEDAIRRAKSVQIPAQVLQEIDRQLPEDDNGDHVRMFARKHRLTMNNVFEGVAKAREEEGDCTNIWEFAQGLTAIAREYEWVDKRIELEQKAGKIISEVTHFGAV